MMDSCYITTARGHADGNKQQPDGAAHVSGLRIGRSGVSWQIVPANLNELVGGKNTAGAQRAMAALLQMTKLDIKELKRAHNQK